MTYWFDDEEREYGPGTTVKDALTPEQRAEVLAGGLEVYDEFAHLVGLEGAVDDGGSYYSVIPGAYPPSVDKCLELLDEPYPREFLKYLINICFDEFGRTGAVSSARFAAAAVRRTLTKEVVGHIFGYVTRERYRRAVYDGWSGVLLFDKLPRGPVVIAVREVIELGDGSSILSAFGAREVREVGTTNKVKLADYKAALPGAGVLVVCKSATFAVEGFAAEPPWADVVKGARENAATPLLVLDGYGLFSNEVKKALDAGFDYIVLTKAPDAADKTIVLLLSEIDIHLGNDDQTALLSAEKALWEALKKQE